MSDLKIVKESAEDDCHPHNEASGNPEDVVYPLKESSTLQDDVADDWEAVADRAPDELLSPQCLPGVSSKVLQEETKDHKPKRRGRGTFSYQKYGLYSDHQQSDGVIINSISENQSVSDHRLGGEDAETEARDLKYGTRHTLVLADFPSSLKTTDLEKLFEKFNDDGVVIRWVNDTTALAVFRSPSIALKACNCIQCAFTVRVLDENDAVLSSIRERDLEPPRQRPKTSARTAQRLIAHGIGLKLPSTSFGPEELKKQEEARKDRLVLRQNMRNDAWGDDDMK